MFGNLLRTLFSVISSAISIYSFICLIYIFMTWIPTLRYTKFGQVIAAICEPYLNLFSRCKWLHVGIVDFSPIISLGLLEILQYVFRTILVTGRIHFGSILGSIIYMFWSVFAMLISLFMILVFVRWIVLLVNHGQTNYNSAWSQIDNMINRITYKLSGFFIRKQHSYQTSLLVTWITILVVRVAGEFLINLLVSLCALIPF